MNKGEEAKEGLETVEQAALRLLQRLEARKYRAAGNGQAAPIHDRLSKSQAMRRLGLSEEKNRRQSPQRVADNDNGRKGESAERVFGVSLDTLSQEPCLGGFWQGFGIRAVGVVVVAINAEMRPTAPKAESYLNGFTMPVLNSNALWGKDQ